MGQWNSQEILCQGRHVRVTLNGEVIVDADLDKVQPVDGRPHPGLKREKGHIGFLGHGADRVPQYPNSGNVEREDGLTGP